MNSNGIYLAHKTGNGVQSIHIDEEVLWFARLNRLFPEYEMLTLKDVM